MTSVASEKTRYFALKVDYCQFDKKFISGSNKPTVNSAQNNTHKCLLVTNRFI